MDAFGKALEIIVITAILNLCYLFGYGHGMMKCELQRETNERSN